MLIHSSNVSLKSTTAKNFRFPRLQKLTIVRISNICFFKTKKYALPLKVAGLPKIYYIITTTETFSLSGAKMRSFVSIGKGNSSGKRGTLIRNGRSQVKSYSISSISSTRLRILES